MMIYRIARGLQLIGLILVPVAVAGNLAEIADAPRFRFGIRSCSPPPASGASAWAGRCSSR